MACRMCCVDISVTRVFITVVLVAVVASNIGRVVGYVVVNHPDEVDCPDTNYWKIAYVDRPWTAQYGSHYVQNQPGTNTTRVTCIRMCPNMKAAFEDNATIAEIESWWQWRALVTKCRENKTITRGKRVVLSINVTKSSANSYMFSGQNALLATNHAQASCNANASWLPMFSFTDVDVNEGLDVCIILKAEKVTPETQPGSCPEWKPLDCTNIDTFKVFCEKEPVQLYNATDYGPADNETDGISENITMSTTSATVVGLGPYDWEDLEEHRCVTPSPTQPQPTPIPIYSETSVISAATNGTETGSTPVATTATDTPSGHKADSDGNLVMYIGLGVGGLLIVILLIAIIVVVVVWRKQRKSADVETSHDRTASNGAGSLKRKKSDKKSDKMEVKTTYKVTNKYWIDMSSSSKQDPLDGQYNNSTF